MQLASIQPQLDKGTTLLALIEEYNYKRATLDAAKRAFDDIENQLTVEVGAKEEGSFTAHIGDFKVTTTGRLNRKVDERKLMEIASALPTALANRLVKTKHEINLKEFRYIENNEPELFKIVAEAVTTTPAKTSIKVERV